MTALRNGYFKLHGLDSRDENLYKVAGFHLDYVLSTIEKYNLFTSKMDFFSKERLFPIIGLATGFCFNTDDLVIYIFFLIFNIFFID